MSHILYSTMVFALAGFLLPISAVIIEGMIGRPSSTAALGLLLAPFSGILGGVVGAISGLVYRALGRVSNLSLFHPTWANYTRALWGIALFITIVLPLGGQLYLNFHSRPRVIVDTNELSPSALSRVHEAVAAIEASGDLLDRDDPWRSDSKYEVWFDSDALTIELLGTGAEIRHSYSRYDYIAGIQCKSLSDPKNNAQYLLVFMRLRSTSRRNMIAVFDDEGSCVYQELQRRE